FTFNVDTLLMAVNEPEPPFSDSAPVEDNVPDPKMVPEPAVIKLMPPFAVTSFAMLIEPDVALKLSDAVPKLTAPEVEIADAELFDVLIDREAGAADKLSVELPSEIEVAELSITA